MCKILRTLHRYCTQCISLSLVAYVSCHILIITELDVYFNIESCDTTFLIIRLKILGTSFIKNYTYPRYYFCKIYHSFDVTCLHIHIYIHTCGYSRVELKFPYLDCPQLSICQKETRRCLYTRIYNILIL